jgi:hypothetical protein
LRLRAPARVCSENRFNSGTLSKSSGAIYPGAANVSRPPYALRWMISDAFPAVSADERIVAYSTARKGMNSTLIPGLRCWNTRIIRSYAHLSSGPFMRSPTAPPPSAAFAIAAMKAGP